jgi:FtsP/CotA-like multicopper oxidase with cupredoxin domain
MTPNRRQFAIGSAAIMGGLVGGLVGSRLAQGQPMRFDRRLPIPPLIDAAKQGDAVKLKVSSGRHAVIKGRPTPAYGYSGPVLGPAIRMRRGDEVQMTVENALGFDTTVHWHGLLVPGDVDGGPHQVIKPGGSWRPRLKIEQPASTAWFHPHLHHDTARQVYMGLTGLITVDDGSDTDLGLPRTYGVDDVPIIIQDRSFDSDAALLYDLDPDRQTIQYGSRGSTIIVNGAVGPVAKVPCGLVRLRILNAANAQNYDLRFSDRREFHIIASDAGFLPRPVAVKQLRISPAERFEVLVDFANRKPVMLETGPDTVMGIFGAVSETGTADFVSIVRFEPTAKAASVKEIPIRLVEPAVINPESVVRRRRFLLDSGICGGQRPSETGELPGMCINGKTHDPARIDVEAGLGTTEVWEIASRGMAHPFHVHGASFRILSLSGAPPPAHLAGWKDVVLVEDEAELLVAFNHLATSEHPFMYHCHILEHEDAGMMGQYVCA